MDYGVYYFAFQSGLVNFNYQLFIHQASFVPTTVEWIFAAEKFHLRRKHNDEINNHCLASKPRIKR